MIKPNRLEKDIVALLQQRLSDEFTAYYFYRSASNWCKDKGFFKASKYFSEESKSELKHAKGIEDYITDWNVLPELPTIQKPQIDFDGLSEIIDKAYEMEYSLYEEYEDTSMKIFQIQDLCTFDFLQFYRKTQRESVAEYADMINILEGVDSSDKYKLLELEDNLFGE